MLNFRQVKHALYALPFVLAAGCFPEAATKPVDDAANMVAKTIPTEASLVGSAAAPAPAVYVSKKNGKAVSGAEVTFTVTAGNGSISATTVKTDKQGIASVGWTYGAAAGENMLVATLGELSPVKFTVTTTGGGPTDMVKFNDGQSASVGEALPQPVSVVVRNASGQPVSGATVVFTAKNGSSLSGAGVTSATVSTDAQGRAETMWTMATVPGKDSLTAAVDGLPTSVFVATAIVGAPFEILTSGDAQSGPVDVVLPTALGITVRDKYHNPVSGLAVAWAPQNGGSASPAADMTNASGQSSTQWKLPVTSGATTLNVSAGGLSSTFIATANAGAPTQIIKMMSSDAQTGDAGQALPQAISVTVRDAHDNPVPNVPVSFSPASGSVNPATAATGSDGQANTIWTLGSAAGGTTLSASAPGVANAVTFTATVRAVTDPCSSHGTLVIGTAVSGNLANSQCAFPLRGTHVDLWTLDLTASTAVEVVQTMDGTESPDAYMAMYRGQYFTPQLAAANDDIDGNNGNYNSHVRFLGGAGRFLVGASYAQWFAGDPGAAYHLVAKSWNGAVTSCQDVFAVSGTSTNQMLDNDDCPASSKRAHSDKVQIMLRPGETLVVTMNSSAFDAKLELESSNGTTIASDDNGGGGTNARLSYTVPAGGASVDTYAIYATSVAANGGGSYSFAVTVNTPPGTSPMMRSSSSTSDLGPGIQTLLQGRKLKTLR